MVRRIDIVWGLIALTIAAGLWAIATTADGATWQKRCASGETGLTLQHYERGCWEIAQNELAGVQSDLITINAQSARFIYDSNTGASGGSVTDGLYVFECPRCVKEPSNPEYACFNLGGNQGFDHLSGLEGEPDTQNSHLRVGPGCYYLELGVQAPTAARVVVQAEGPKNL